MSTVMISSALVAVVDGLPLVNIGQGALLSLAVLLVLTDKLVWHKRLEKIEQKLEIQGQHLTEALKQNTILLESAIPTVNAVLGALHNAVDENRGR